MSRRTFLAAGAAVLSLWVHNAARADIIDDKSDFVGDFTVIDFETLGDGTPLILNEPLAVDVRGDEYPGVVIGGITQTHEPGFVIANFGPGITEAGQYIVGSLENLVIPGTGLRFDFYPSVNAVGMAVMDKAGPPSLSLEIYDSEEQLIEAVLFDGALIDGTLLGADFGTQFDKDYGFMGLFSPDVEIASALLFTELDFQFQVDDLHFGVIPEPTTMMLLFTGLVALATTHGRLRLFRRRTIRMTLIIVAASFPAARGSEVISGTVTGWVDLTAGPICGVIQPPQCTNPALSL